MTPSSHVPLSTAIDTFHARVHCSLDVEDESQRQTWCDLASDAFDQLTKTVAIRRREIHAQVFREVARREPDKRPDIERLKRVDRNIHEYQGVVQAHLAAFAADTGLDPEGLANQLEELRLAVDELLASLSEQEKAVVETFLDSTEAHAVTA